MKFENIKVGYKVKDYIYGQERIGKVIQKLKTRVHIQYNEDDILIYDKAHTQFLTWVKRYKKRS